MSEANLSWTVGAVKITRIVEVEMPIPHDPKHPFLLDATPEALQEIPWLYPHYVTPEGHLRLSVHALLVEAPGLRLVVDTCFGNDKPSAFMGGRALSTSFLQHMQDAGWPRDSVNAVICTHLHSDHVGWNTIRDGDRWVPTFPNARYLMGKAEFEFWSGVDDADTASVLSASVQPVFDAGLVDLVDMDHVLSPEIRLIPTPGHTPGHVSVMIESQGQSAMITGDAVHHPSQIARPHWSPPFDTDQAASQATRRSMYEAVADKPILVIGTHFAAPTAGHVTRDGDSYRFDG